jgi:hypothetical protein
VKFNGVASVLVSSWSDWGVIIFWYVITLSIFPEPNGEVNAKGSPKELRNWPGEWAIWTVETADDGAFKLRSHTGRYIAIKASQPVAVAVAVAVALIYFS